MNVNILSECPEWRQKTLDLIEKEFCYKEDAFFEIDFLPLVHKSNLHNCHIITHDEKVIGHIGVREECFCYRHVQVPAVFIGGIAIDKHYKKQGYFRQLFERVLRIYESRGAFFLLWSGNASLYEKFDFFEFGVVYEHNLEDRKENTPYRRERYIGSFLEDLKKIYSEQERKYLVVQRDQQKWKMIEKMTSLDFYLHINNKKLIGYYVKNKGQDLQGIVHEYSNLSNVKEARIWGPQPFSPFDYTHFLGLMRIGSERYFSNFIHSITEGAVAVKTVHSKDIVFTFQRREYKLKLKDFIHALWGPSLREDISLSVPPFWVSGIDSV